MENTSKSTQLESVLWGCADILRGKMDANEYKDYILGLLFYKYLSDKLLYTAEAETRNEGDPKLTVAERQKRYEQYYSDPDFVQELKANAGFVLDPKLTFESLMGDIERNEFQLGTLSKAFNEIEGFGENFANVFDDVDLNSKKLGNTEAAQNKVISELMSKLDEVDLLDYSTDALGDAYEYMLGQFASETGKKAGEFYTPTAVANLMAHIVMLGHENKEGLQVYDPTCGSGSLLLDIGRYSNKKETIHYWGQELNASTYNLAKMNMMIHGITLEHQHLHNGDTLDADWPTEEETDFDCVVMNPPYSAKWSAEPGFLNTPRFSSYGALAPKSKADYAFLLHGFYHLKKDGTMGIVLPHGVLFRGAAEGTIRKKLIDDGSIYAVIGLPANLFYNTTIPTIIMILKKDRGDMSRDILFIDASKDFEKGKNQNKLTDQNAADILKLYLDRKDVEKKAHLASYDEIVKNDYNLNIPRYVDTFDAPEAIDISDVNADLKSVNAEIKENTKSLVESLGELTSDDEKLSKDIQDLIEILKEE